MTEIRSPMKVLITGAHGLIGNIYFAHLASLPEKMDVYAMTRALEPTRKRLADYHDISYDRIKVADLADFDAVKKAVEGMDVVVHLAADSSGREGWDSVLDNNIRGTYHVLEASRLAGVKRVIFASTNQTVFGYRLEEPYKALFEGRFKDVPANYQPITVDMPARTLNHYSASKVWGEMTCFQYAHMFNLSCIVLRVGWVLAEDRPPIGGRFDGRILWCSQRDIMQILDLCVKAPEEMKYEIVFGQSENRYNLVDIQHTKAVLGYRPEDSAENFYTPTQE